jgi:solute carrier family 25 S-adenosylmethionine transporter 26
VGGASRSFAQALLYPVDAMRTLAQTRDGRTLADLGVKTLTKGCFQTSGFALFQGALQFGIFEACRENMGPLAASALGAAGSCVVSVPQEVIKQRLVTGVYSSFREAVSTIYAQEGLKGFYSSWRPTMMRNVPFVIITFTTMDIMKRKRLLLKKNNQGEEEKDLSMVENVLIGMSSAMVGGIVTHPVDFIKTRMMTQAASNAAPYSSALDCVLTVFRTEGPMTFYSGFPQRSVYMCGLWGITFALNGKFNKLIDETSDGERK